MTFDIKYRNSVDRAVQDQLMRRALIKITTGEGRTTVKALQSLALDALVRVTEIDNSFFRDLEMAREREERAEVVSKTTDRQLPLPGLGDGPREKKESAT